MRRLGIFKAILASISGLGLGYVYIGRMKVAVLLILLTFGNIAFFTWIRLIFQPWSLYIFLLIAFVLSIFPIFHVGRIAFLTKEAPPKKYNRWWIYLIWIACSWTVSSITLGNRAQIFGYETFRIVSASMSPTLQPVDFIMSDTWRYKNVNPAIGEIVVFNVPDTEGVKFVFRVVGVPGDQLEMRNSVLYRNDLPVTEPYVYLEENNVNAPRNFGPFFLDNGEYFVMGDNRYNAKDSRYIGPISEEYLHGRVEFIWISFSRRNGIEWDRFPHVFNQDT